MKYKLEVDGKGKWKTKIKTKWTGEKGYYKNSFKVIWCPRQPSGLALSFPAASAKRGN